MAQYLLSVHHAPDADFGTEEEVQGIFGATGTEPVVTDGPFAESKEYLGGFWIIEAADLDEALAWATEGSAACRGRVEVRPFQAA